MMAINKTLPPNISVAPMMNWTDRHCRFFLRLFSKDIKLYTEMVVENSIIYGDRHRFLDFDLAEHPVALQLGGSNPQKLATCAKLAEEWGYDEVNLNVGCPSDRVKNAGFGACLMLKPDLVMQCIAAMKSATRLPVTVKTRIGVDDQDSYQCLRDFIYQVSSYGCGYFIIHARKAWLKGISPKQNRTIPPLQYETVYRLKQDYPHLQIVINGGICLPSEVESHLVNTDGVMIGREAYHNPWLLREIHDRIFSRQPTDTEEHRCGNRFEIVHKYLEYVEKQLSNGVYLTYMTRHMLGLFHKQPGAKAWRRYLSEYCPKKGAGTEVIQQALTLVEQAHV